ncbi:Pyridoxal kinase [Collichthys lucidus]|uniref:Pyridoxal kinase n=1 Tax=Collichthys lucidus TaxID=240159 RepID=A0A4U5VCZ8_COLLU|nr:Pyridoxal kinase [Collichthys lucidus]
MECRVLSIQSHVVRGYVGNKSASFPLQDKESQACQRASRRRCEEAALRLAATGFLLVTSPKMETGSLRAGLDRFGFHIETKFKMTPV